MLKPQSWIHSLFFGVRKYVGGKTNESRESSKCIRMSSIHTRLSPYPIVERERVYVIA
jgi:hypothetical protein